MRRRSQALGHVVWLAAAGAAAAPATVVAGTVAAVDAPPNDAAGSPAADEAAGTAAGAARGWFGGGIDLIAGYRSTWTTVEDADPEWFHEFELDRGHGWVEAGWGPARARLLAEATRATGEGALVGVAGDSVVLRLREAWAGCELFGWGDVAAGIVPTLAQPTLERGSGTRVLGASAFERHGLLGPADLGASAALRLPWVRGRLAVALYDGEGYAQRELNRGKSWEFFAELRPLGVVEGLGPLVVSAAYLLGSQGAGSSRADRVVAGLAWEGDRIGGAVAFLWLWGVDGAGERQGWAIEGSLRGAPTEWLLLAARVAHVVRDADDEQNRLTEAGGGVGFRPLEPFEVWLDGGRVLAGETARAASPGCDQWWLAARLRFRWSGGGP